MAAYKAGIKNVIIPKDNERDIVEIDETVRKHINFIPVSTIDEVLHLVIKPVSKTKEKVRQNIIITDNKSSGRRNSVTQ